MLVGALDGNLLVLCGANSHLSFKKPSEKKGDSLLCYLIHVLVLQVPSLAPEFPELYIHIDLRPKGL